MKSKCLIPLFLLFLSLSIHAGNKRPVPEPTEPPGIPSSITVPLQSYTGAFTVLWGASSGGVTSYQLYQQKDGEAWSLVGSTSRYDRDVLVVVTASGNYRYRVRACNQAGCGSYRTSGEVAVELPPVDQPGDLRIRLEESSIDNALAAISAARGINFAEHGGGFISSWYVNLESASIDIQPGNLVVLHAQARAVTTIDLWVFSFDIVEQINAIMHGALLLEPFEGGLRLMFESDSQGVALSGDLPDWLEALVSVGATTFLSRFYSLDLTPGTIMLPQLPTGHFAQPQFGLMTNDDEVIVYLDLEGNQPPQADFNASASFLNVAFSDQSTDPDGQVVSRSWFFGDGAASNLIHPSHTYAAAGTYSVTLTVVDDDGSSDTWNENVTVQASAPIPPVADFSFSTNYLAAAFTDQSSDADGHIVSRSWSFGDGATSAATNPSHSYSGAGTYSVSLTVTDNGGYTNTRTRSVAVQAQTVFPPVASFTTSQNPSGKTVDYQFNGAASYDPDSSNIITWYKWEVTPQGGSTSVRQGATMTTTGYSYFGPDSLTVKLTVTDNEGHTGSKTRIYEVCPPFYSNAGLCGAEIP